MAGLRLEIRVDDKGTATVKKVEQAHSRLEKKVVAQSARMSKASAKLRKRWQSARATLARYSTFAKLALAGLAVAAIVVGAKFEQSMANVGAVSGATAKDLAILTSAARELGATTAFTASQAGDAMMSLAQAGQSVNEILQTSGDVLLFAGAAGTGLQESAESLVQTLAMFNLSAGQSNRVVNVFAAAMGNSLLNAERLREGLSQVGATSAAVGMTLEETVGVLGQLNNAGMLGGIAGTRLKNVLVRLAAPTKLLKKLVGESVLETGSFADKMAALSKTGATAGEVFKAFGRIAGPAVLTLMQQGREEADSMRESITGTQKAQEMFEKQMKTLGSQFKIFKSQVQENMIAVFGALQPILMRTVRSMTSGLAKAKPVIIGVALTAIRLGSAIKALVVRTRSLIVENAETVKLFLGIAAGLTAIAVASAIASAALAVLTSPITLIIAGAAALTLVWVKWGDQIKEVLASAWASFVSIGEGISGWAGEVWRIISWPFRQLMKLATKAAGIFKKVFPGAAAAVEGMLETLKEKGGSAIDFVVEKGSIAANAVKDTGVGIVQTIVGAVKEAKTKVGAALGEIKTQAKALAAVGGPGERERPTPDPEIGWIMAFGVTRDQAKGIGREFTKMAIKEQLRLEDERRAGLLRTAAAEEASTEAWLSARVALIEANYEDEEAKALDSAEKIAELQIERDAQIAETRREHNQAVVDEWMSQNQMVLSGLDALGAGYDSLFATIARGETTTRKLRENAIKAIRATFIRNTGSMIKYWITEHLKGLLITRTAEQAAARSRKTEDAKTGAVRAYSAFASIPFVGPILGAAAAAAAFAFLIAFNRGGDVPGTSFGRDTVPALLEPQEFVIRRTAAQSVGSEALEHINRTGALPAGGAGAGVEINLSVGEGGGSVAEELEELLEDEVVPAIEDLLARRRGFARRPL